MSKKYYIILGVCSVFFNLNLFSQNVDNKIHYTYDMNGNRTSRTLIIIPENNNKIKQDTSQLKEIDNHQSILLYPNPANNSFKITLKDDKHDKISTIEIYNTNGALINSIKNINRELNIDVSEYKSGIYLVVVQTDKNIYKYKILKN